MPVVVTGADSELGRRVVAVLADRGLDVRATVDAREEVAALVARGVKTAVSDLGDAERFGAVVENAHTVVHLRGADLGALTVLDGIDDVLAALPESGVARVVTIAPLLGNHSAIEALRGSAYDTVVLRVGVVLADPPAEAPRLRARLRCAPVHVDDLVAAIVAADRARDLHGHHDLPVVGPDVVSGAELARLLGVRPRRLARRGADLVGDGGLALRSVLAVDPEPLGSVAVRIREARRG